MTNLGGSARNEKKQKKKQRQRKKKKRSPSNWLFSLSQWRMISSGVRNRWALAVGFFFVGEVFSWMVGSANRSALLAGGKGQSRVPVELPYYMLSFLGSAN